MRLAFVLIGFVLQIVAQSTDSAKTNALKVSYLEAGNTIDYEPASRHRGFFENDLRSYCYRGNSKTLGRFFETIELQLEIESDDYTQYEGTTPQEVKEHHEQQRSLFSFNLFSQKKLRLQLSPFQQQCIGIETVEPYRVRLQQVRVDFWRVIQLALGLTLFLTAAKLSHNAVFYYITGVALGICSSFMLLIWLAGKLVPRRPLMYGVLIGGWTIGIYIIQMLWENLQLIVLTYRTYVFWYILITGLVSFFFCYRLGPPKNQRSKNIIKWLLQLTALGLIYFCSHFEEASAAFIIIAICYYYFPRALIYRMRALYLRRFPPKRRMLTNEEYYEQGVRETTRALSELREFANSPDCKQWKVMAQLRDPLRFGAFVEGASHLRDEEILRFESARLDDDELDDSDESMEEQVNMPKTRRSGSYLNKPSPPRSIRYAQHTTSSRTYAADNHADFSDEDGEYAADFVAATNSSYKLHQHTPTLSNTKSLKNGHLPVSSPRNAIAPHSLARASKLVSSAQQRRSTSVRTFETQDYSGESE